MLETSVRLLELLALFQGRRSWSGSELSERAGVTGRTLRRDVDRLRRLGYPVDSTSGAGGGYRLSAGSTLPPLLLEDDEAVAVAVGLRTAAGGTVSGIEEASLRALSKLQQVLPRKLHKRVAALNAFILPLENKGPSVDAAILASIAGACRDAETLRFAYRAQDGAQTRRHVEPHRLVHTGRRWYLAAWDRERGDWRTFRVDRIEPRLRTGPTFTPREPPEGGFATWVSRSVTFTTMPFEAVVLLHASAQDASERLPPAAGSIEAIDEATCLLRSGAHSIDRLAVWLALIGFDFEVRDPPELIGRVQELAGRLNRATAPREASPTK